MASNSNLNLDIKENLALPAKENLALWQKYCKQSPPTVKAVQKSFVRHVSTTLARTTFNCDKFAAYAAAAHSVRDRLIKDWNDTQEYHTEKDPKRVYYLSLEFLLGRSLDNALLSMDVKNTYTDGLKQLGYRMEDLLEEEMDAGLGNGGLGRLAACYMDSLASLDYPAWGYGIRYTYGIFQQRIVDGYQTEYPDYWLNFDNPWEIPRHDITYQVRFHGHVTKLTDDKGKTRYSWEGGDIIRAVAYDMPIPGYGTKNTITIRLWSSKPNKQFDLASFNEGNYDKSVEEQRKAETISSVLYPNDNHMVGKELRLKQQYFFVTATLHDIVRRFKKTNRPWEDFPNQVAIQLNDTHPSLGIAELMRILVDAEGLTWDESWAITTKVFSFTNHTVLPEAMERWSVPLLEKLLPRHMQIIYDINLFFLQSVEKVYPGDREILMRISVIEEGYPQYVRMAHLAVVGSHTVNGVAELHSMLIKTTIFQDFVKYYGPEKFQNKTNGVTPRRWLHQCNPRLSALITEKLGSREWLKDLYQLKKLVPFATDKAFQQKWLEIKRYNKERLAKHLKDQCGVTVSADALFDVQVKRIHEYKRQFMNILSVIHRYNRLKSMSPADRRNEVPRVVIFGGKAAPGYYVAKLVIKLINSVSSVINADKDIGNLLKLVFIPDYDVSLAEIIIPASDISQHISTAGTEASGTSNMKFVLNGGLIIGTVDGANIEIGEEIGADNIFFFGVKTEQVDDLRHKQRYRGVDLNPKLRAVIASIEKGDFGVSDIYGQLLGTLTEGRDFYLLSADFDAYLDAQKAADECYKDKDGWVKKSILCSANMGKFSADRAVKEYAEKIWHIKPFKCPLPPA